MKFLRLLPFCLTLLGLPCLAQQPLWIWHTKQAADGEVRYFRKEVNLEAAPTKAKLEVTCDNEAIVYLNGKEAGATDDWQKPIIKPVEAMLQKGTNIIAVRGKNHEGAAALVLRLTLEMPGGAKRTIVTDESWQSGEKEDASWKEAGALVSGWHPAVAIAKLGDAPWGAVFSGGGGGGGGATPAEALATLPGFAVELVMTADKTRNGSWISMAKDDDGRLLLGSQTGNTITRLTLTAEGKVAKEEDLQLPFTDVMGLLWAFKSLYVNAEGQAPDGKSGHGIYRLQDTKGDGHFDKIEQILVWANRTGGGEHGSHGMVVGPDGKIYVCSGNFTDAPTNISAHSPHRNFQDDLILGRAEDGNGFGANRKPPGGIIVRIDPDGGNPELFAGGERNTYDIAFNADGELIGFDSDMEWDWGMPWYRPIRIYHAVSAADQGFREGSGKWPEYYPDSVPAVKNIGLGSPTGVVFGSGAKFPAKYQRAFYALDWAYGRLIAAHLQPVGATYTATWENFVAPKALQEPGAKPPLNLTDTLVGPDGALYFTVGGRGTVGALYRVTYTGTEPTAPAELHDAAGKAERETRHQLEAYHGKVDGKAVSYAWPFLGDKDRAIRYAARIAIESQPLAEWKDRALQEIEPTTALNGLLALARLGGKQTQPELIAALSKLQNLSDENLLAKVRILEITTSRNGAPAHAESLVQELDALYPAKSIELNRELSQTLLALDSPTAVMKTVRLLQAAPTQEEQITYLLFLRKAKTGWTPETHTAYFNWWLHRPPATHPPAMLQYFKDVGHDYADGASFSNFLANFHQDAVQSLTGPEIDQLQGVLAAYIPPNARPPRQATKQHTSVKAWTMADLEPLLPKTAHGRNFANGRDGFAAAQCILCHRFGDEGGAVGPDLTTISSRYSMHDILESIIDPSKVISEQYANEEFTLKNGDTVMGRLVGETPDTISVRPSLLAPQIQQVKKADIKDKALSKVSPMPPGLLNILTEEDVLDLLAYLASGGKQDSPAFRP